ncbi:MAG: hypothetical protein KF789_08445 [Bdellovibrionaceae bacterium]|nr:hypothetical protein [Pseudobdellovibrionaceae bacterium]
MNKIALVLVAFAVVGCKKIPGSLTVQTEFSATVKNGIFSRAQEIKIPAGQYQIELSGDLGGDLSILLPLNGKTQKIRLDIPKKGYNTPNGRFPTENGTFALTSQQLKQPFNVNGEVRTTYNDGPSLRTTEYCQYPRETRVCVIDRETGRSSCSTQTEYVSGDRDVEYFQRNEAKRIWLELQDASRPSITAASYQGLDNSSYRVYTYQGRCHPRFGWF